MNRVGNVAVPPRQIISSGTIVAILVILGITTVIISLVIVGKKAEEAHDKEQKEKEAAEEAARKAAEEEAKREEEEREKEEAEKEQEEEALGKPKELAWIGLQDDGVSLAKVTNCATLVTSWVNAGPGKWDNMRIQIVLRQSLTYIIQSVAPGIIVSARDIIMPLTLNNRVLNYGLVQLLQSRYPDGIRGKTLTPAGYYVSDWIIVLKNDVLQLIAKFKPITSFNPSNNDQPTIMFDLSNIRGVK